MTERQDSRVMFRKDGQRVGDLERFMKERRSEGVVCDDPCACVSTLEV